MMNFRKGRTSRLISLAVLASVALVGCGSKSGPAVANVNGTPITKEEFYGYLERMQLVQVQTPQGTQSQRVAGSLGLQALNDLVRRQLVLQLAEENGLLPNDADIEAELAFQTKRRPDFVSFLTNQGMSLQSIRNDIRFDLARERLLTRGVEMPADEVDSYIRENPDKFVEPAQAQLLYVVVSDPKRREEVDRELASGQSFQVVATRFSEAPRAKELGGMFPESRISAMHARLQEIVGNTQELRATDWVADGANWVKFYVQRKTQERPLDMDEVRREYLRRQLAMQRGEEKNNIGRLLQEKMQTAKVEVQAEHLRGPWDDAFKKAQEEIGRSMQTETVADGRQ
jgi:foldase protein PrsA